MESEHQSECTHIKVNGINLSYYKPRERSYASLCTSRYGKGQYIIPKFAKKKFFRFSTSILIFQIF